MTITWNKLIVWREWEVLRYMYYTRKYVRKTLQDNFIEYDKIFRCGEVFLWHTTENKAVNEIEAKSKKI